MLKLKLQYFGHLIQRADSLEKTMMLGKIEGRRIQRIARREKKAFLRARELHVAPQWIKGTMECSPPGSSVHGISQARILEWVAILSARGSF